MERGGQRRQVELMGASAGFSAVHRDGVWPGAAAETLLMNPKIRKRKVFFLLFPGKAVGLRGL